LILDLEDAVAPDAKPAARELACAAAASGAYAMRELTIRINGLGSPWHEENLSAVCAAGPDGIVVPNVGTAGEVRSAGRRHGGRRGLRTARRCGR
jgi:citrate lyase subunit beta / citryl-CoA lyase